MNAIDPAVLAAAVEKAKAKLAERAAKQANSISGKLAANRVETPTMRVLLPEQMVETPKPGEWAWNIEQQNAIDYGVNRTSFTLIGAAGTGKTTTLRGMLKEMLRLHRVPMLDMSTAHLSAGTPGIVLVSYTRRAVRNIAKQMPEELKSHCLTIHKLLEFAPVYYEDYNEEGKLVNKMKFEPTRHRQNPLPRTLKTIVVDESSMVSIDLFELLLDALPGRGADVQFVFLGDLNQLPPVYGQAILGVKLLQLPIIELTRVYRQALESPIIALALSVKNNRFLEFNKDAHELWGAEKEFDIRNVTKQTTLYREGRGKVTIQPWKKQFDMETATILMRKQINVWIETGYYKPDEDLILCPWNKAFGTDELNRGIANTLGKARGAIVHEVIAGFQKHYLAVGDKVLVDKQEAIILDIQRNTKYIGEQPGPASKDLDRWGAYQSANFEKEETLSDADVDAILDQLGSTDVTERTHEASHTIKVKSLDADAEVTLSKAAEFNSMTFGYAITVHKAQGSECRKVFLLTHYCHAAMLFRELVYTGITRAAEELHIIQSPMMLQTAAKKPRIKGDTLAAKLEFFQSRLKERLTDGDANE